MNDPQQPRRFVPYLRVSTDKQGRSGLGMEAQEAALAAFIRPGDVLLSPPFVEVESGKKSDRPQLAAALAKCRRSGATLLIAKLDRLARNVAFVSRLMEEGVPFVAADMPNATPFMLHIYAAVAEEEARAISKRTRAALAAAKARGVKLGGERPGAKVPSVASARKGATVSASVRQAAADQAARDVLARIEELRAQHFSFEMVAAQLAEEGVATPRGGAWTGTAVRRALLRAGGVS
jgi:DNA invertase Pin-like site-specific DNA recombinase